jgi:hypothetical protein
MITFIIIWWLILGLLAARVIWVSQEVKFKTTLKGYDIPAIIVFCSIVAFMGPISVYMTLDAIPDKKYKFW